MNYKGIVKIAVSLLVLLVVCSFYFLELRERWMSIEFHKLRFEWLFVMLSFATVLTTCLLTTYGWFITLNSLSSANKISFAGSVAIVNSSNLSKYVPGKVWSYALQMYLFAQNGFPKSLIVYVSLINIFISLMTFLMLGIGFLMLSPGKYPSSVTALGLLILLVVDISFILFNSIVFKGVVSFVNKIFKRNIQYFETTARLLAGLHLVYCMAAFSFGLCAYLMSLGMGFHVANGEVLTIMSSLIISDVIGFLAVIVPGGLGVREGMMYFMLSGGPSESLSLILPIATRIVNMLVDLCLGAVGLVLLKKFNAAAQAGLGRQVTG